MNEKETSPFKVENGKIFVIPPVKVAPPLEEISVEDMRTQLAAAQDNKERIEKHIAEIEAVLAQVG